jgi:hypothetical protein
VILFPVVAADLATVGRSAILSRQGRPSHVEIDNDAEPAIRADGQQALAALARGSRSGTLSRQKRHRRERRMLAEVEQNDRAPCSGRQRIVRLGNGWNAAKDRA